MNEMMSLKDANESNNKTNECKIRQQHKIVNSKHRATMILMFTIHAQWQYQYQLNKYKSESEYKSK